MNEKANADAGAGEQPEAAPKEAPRTVSHEAFTGVVEQRQALKGTVREQAAELAEYKAREKEAADAKMREQGEFQQLLEQERAEKTDYKERYEQRLYQEKLANTAAKVSAKTGLDIALVEGMLLREKQVSGTDVALEDLNDDSVTQLAKALRASVPQLFETKGVGGSPTIPGLNKGKGGDDPYGDLARRLSPGRAK